VGKSFIKSLLRRFAWRGSDRAVLHYLLAFCVLTTRVNPDAAAVTQVWSYIGELLFNMLVLVARSI
jgi:hypothetical protein